MQLKPSSAHDPKVLRGVFKGFVDRAFSICSDNRIDEELEFLIDVFEENGYQRRHLKSIVESQKHQRQQQQQQQQQSMAPDQSKIVKLPWIPGVSPKLRAIFRKAGYKAIFKSGSNLQTLRTKNNKSILPVNSNPGIYKISCTCGQTYIGETKMKVSTRIKQHQKSSFDGNTEHSGVCAHDANCTGDIMWEEKETQSWTTLLRT